MRSTTHAVAAASLLAGVALTQTPAVTSPGLTATAGTVTNTSPPGPVTSAVTVTAQQGSGPSRASASTVLTPLGDGLSWSATTSAVGAFFTPRAFGGANSAVAMSLPGRGAGTIVITPTGSADSGGSLTVSVDVGADGNAEVVANSLFPSTLSVLGSTVRVPVCFETGLSVNVILSASAAPAPFTGAGNANCGVTVRFVPGQAAVPAVITADQPGCGATLNITDTIGRSSHLLDFAVSGGLGNSAVALAFGTDSASIPLAPGCTLWLTPVAAVLLTADASGAAAWSLPLPAPIQSPPLLIQAVSFDVTGLRATDSLSVELDDC